jgi:threonine/homoserine/homoserine lactone efflux protein
MKSLKNRYRKDGGTRTHSVAMSIGHMETIYTFITAQLASLPSDISTDTFAQRALRMECLCYLAFSTVAWNLWTR